MQRIVQRSLRPSGMNMMFMQARSFAAFQKAVLKPLPYDIGGLEPVIS